MAGVTADGRRIGMRTARRIRQVVAYAGIFVVLIYSLLPLVWMVSTSLKSEEQLRIRVPIQWVPQPLDLENYVEGWQARDWPKYLGNTMYWASMSSIGLLCSTTLAGYAFARMKFPGRDTLMFLNIVFMLLPYTVTMVPVYILNARLQWVGTWNPVIVPMFLAAAPHFVFLLRQFFRTIPPELSEAARIDGCGEFGIFWRIILPLSKPALVVMTVATITWAWSDLLNALIYLKDEQHQTLVLAMQVFIQARGQIGWGPMMAMAVVWAAPMVVLYYFSQRYFSEAFTLSGITG